MGDWFKIRELEHSHTTHPHDEKTTWVRGRRVETRGSAHPHDDDEDDVGSGRLVQSSRTNKTPPYDEHGV